MTQTTNTLGDLSVEQRARLEAWLMAFDAEWKRGLMQQYVGDVPVELSSFSSVCLLELAKVDLDRRWSDGEQMTVEDYLSKFPSLGDVETVSADLLLAEYLARKAAGESDVTSLIFRRFPNRAAELNRLLQEERRGTSIAGRVASARETTTGKTDTQSVVVQGAASPVSPAQPTDYPARFGRYTIQRQLGCGAMGAVFLADDSQLHRQVALKTPSFDSRDSEDLVERFYREARSAANLRHANICPVYDVGEIDGVHYITMAYIDGRPLSQFIKPNETLAERTAAALIRKMALALQHAHEAGIIHRDLKPSNIMIDRQKEPVIMDFGLARKLHSGEESRVTQQGMILGTPAYMSPEQAHGDLEAGPPSDIYSLGAILFELLTGRLPFEGSVAAIIGQIIVKDPPKPSEFRADLDPALEAVCLKMMARSQEERYASMTEVVSALTDYLKPFQPPSDPDGSDRWKALPPLAKWSALGGLAAILVLSVVLIFRRPDGGTLRIEVDDPNLTVLLDGDELTLTDKSWEGKKKDQKHQLAVKVGGQTLTIGSPTKITLNDGRTVTHKLTLTLNGAELSSDSFEIVRGETTVVKIGYERIAGEKPAPKPVSKSILEPVSSFETNAAHVRFSADGRFVLALLWEELKRLAVYDAKTGRLIRLSDTGLHQESAKKKSYPTAMAVSPTETLAAGTNSTGRLLIWDYSTGKPRHILENRTGGTAALSFSPDGRRLLSSAWMRKGRETVTQTCVWNVASGTRERVIDQTENAASAISPDGRFMATIFQGNLLYREFPSGKVVRRIPLSIRSKPPQEQQIVFTNDGQRLAVSAGSNQPPKISIYHVGNGRLIAAPPLIHPDLGPAGNVRFLAGDRLLLSAHKSAGNRRRAVMIWDANSGRLLQQIDGAYSADVSSNGEYVVTLGPQEFRGQLWRVSKLAGASKPTPAPIGPADVQPKAPPGEKTPTPPKPKDASKPVDLLALIPRSNLRLVNPDGQRRLRVPSQGVIDIANYSPPEEYDLQVTVRRFVFTKGNTGRFGVRLPVGTETRTCVVYIDGEFGHAMGIGRLDGKGFRENETIKRYRKTKLTIGKDHTLIYRVRKDSISASLNGQSFVDWTGQITRLPLARDGKRLIGFDANNAAFVITKAVVIPKPKTPIQLAIEEIKKKLIAHVESGQAGTPPDQKKIDAFVNAELAVLKKADAQLPANLTLSFRVTVDKAGKIVAVGAAFGLGGGGGSGTGKRANR